MNPVTKYAHDMLWVDPAAKREAIVAELIPDGEAVSDAFLARVATTRKRVMDQTTGKRVTRDWRIGYFLMWKDGVGAVKLDREQAESIFASAKSHNIDEIVVHGRTSFVGSDRITFRQFGVRDIASL